MTTQRVLTRNAVISAFTLLSVLPAVEAAQESHRASPSTQTSSSAPFTVIFAQPDFTNKTVTVTVQNNGPKVITAWNVTLEVGTAPDAVYGGYGVDAYRGCENLVRGSSCLGPHGTATVEIRLPLESKLPAQVQVAPWAAIFGDGSTWGNEKIVDGVFNNRDTHLAAWQQIARELQEADSSETLDLISKLEGIVVRLSNGPDDGGRIVRKTFSANLSLGLADARVGRAQATAVRTRLLQAAQREVNVASAHGRRQ